MSADEATICLVDWLLWITDCSLRRLKMLVFCSNLF